MHLSIGQAAALLGVSVSTLRRWEREGFLLPAYRPFGGHRRFALATLETLFLKDSESVESSSRVIAYARVSSHDQKKDLETQIEKLVSYCHKNFKDYHIISDLGSGLNYRKPGLKKLLRAIFLRQTQHLVLNHRDRLLRFGSEIIFDLCKHFGVKVTILEKREDLGDVIELMTVFSSRLYGKRSHLNRKKAAA